MTNIKYRQFVPTSLHPEGEFMYWGYGVMSPDGSTDSFVSPIDLHKPSEQWTGLEDGNGIKVYAGDIFNCIYHRDGHTDHHYVVEYFAKEAKFLLRRFGNPCPQNGVVQTVSDVARYPMIGNVHENLELIKS